MAEKLKNDNFDDSALSMALQSSSINRSFFFSTTSCEVAFLILQLKGNKAQKVKAFQLNLSSTVFK